MTLAKYIVEHIDLDKLTIFCSLKVENNSLKKTFYFEIESLYVEFRISDFYGVNGKLKSRKSFITYCDDIFKSQTSILEDKITMKLKENKFIEKLNNLIKQDKERLSRNYKKVMSSNMIEKIEK